MPSRTTHASHNPRRSRPLRLRWRCRVRALERRLESACAGLFPLRPPRLDGFLGRRRLLHPMRCAQMTRQGQAMGEAPITLRTLDVFSTGDADGSQSYPARALAIAGGSQRVADAVQHCVEILEELPLPVLELLLLPLQGLTIARQGAERLDEFIDHTLGSSVVVTVVRHSTDPGPESQAK